jgi:hypothetical protein
MKRRLCVYDTSARASIAVRTGDGGNQCEYERGDREQRPEQQRETRRHELQQVQPRLARENYPGAAVAVRGRSVS